MYNTIKTIRYMGNKNKLLEFELSENDLKNSEYSFTLHKHLALLVL